jgi:hypothetical protein
MLRQVLVRVVSDRVALHRIGLEIANGVIDLLHPSVVAGREDRMREHPFRAGETVHVGARLRLHLVCQEPVFGNLRRRAADAGDLRIAVEINLLQVIRKHQVIDRLFLTGELRIPAGLADGASLIDERLNARTGTQKMRMHVHDELAGQLLCAIVGALALRGFGTRYPVERTVCVVQR